jgi:hypothetical protein
MVGLHTTRGDEGITVLPLGLWEKVYELAGLVPSPSQRKQIITLDSEIDVQAIAKPRSVIEWCRNA